MVNFTCNFLINFKGWTETQQTLPAGERKRCFSERIPWMFFFSGGFKVQFVVEVEGDVWLQDVLFFLFFFQVIPESIPVVCFSQTLTI